MSHPHLQEQPQPELAYQLSRSRRRWLVALMETGALCALVASSMLRGRLDVVSIISLGGLLMSAACYFMLFSTMKAIHLNAPRNLDERQNMISGHAYRNAFHILMIVGCLAFLLNLFGWLNWLNLKIVGIWLLTMVQALPMAVMAWTEPD